MRRPQAGASTAMRSHRQGGGARVRWQLLPSSRHLCSTFVQAAAHPHAWSSRAQRTAGNAWPAVFRQACRRSSRHATFVDGPQCKAEDIEGNWRAAVCADACAARTELVARRSGQERRSDRICMTELTIFEVSGFACDALKADGPSSLPMCVCVRARVCVCVCVRHRKSKFQESIHLLCRKACPSTRSGLF